ncbi:MAG TPA: hypothetical protein VEQ63_07715 [Bryobacteraceae bacterium]|nr:hypothetical protein [Bryobacteraceae bacterium]
MAAQDDAIRIVDEFEAAPRLGVWTNISPADAIKGLRERVQDPAKINQGGSLLCGPAAFAFDLAKTDPVAYVKAIINLYTGGTAVIGTLLLQPAKDLIFNRFSGGVEAVDWILLSSLRDSSNWFFDVESVDDLLSVATLPSTITTWLQRVGYTKIVNKTNVWFIKDFENLREANELKAKEYRIFLFINSNMLHADRRTTTSLAPDHWIMLQSGIDIAGPPLEGLKTVSFVAYSWGETKTVPDPKRKEAPFRLRDFLSNYYGYVAFKH